MSLSKSSRSSPGSNNLPKNETPKPTFCLVPAIIATFTRPCLSSTPNNSIIFSNVINFISPALISVITVSNVPFKITSRLFVTNPILSCLKSGSVVNTNFPGNSL
ncbi:hypothetical protein K7432_017715 [Basidiobolus ranarum]|uniref:Uncharacterized protein n=1 Tax=Basidiobolus ranarum TaxID=34480 RepID=A0ABR2WD12_9FUNG